MSVWVKWTGLSSVYGVSVCTVDGTYVNCRVVDL